MIKKEKQRSQSSTWRNKPWRQLWHLTGGSFFPILAFFVPIEIVRISLGIITAFFVIWEAVRLSSPRVNTWMLQHLRLMMKKEESYRPTGTTWLLVASIIVFCLFDKFVAITSLLFLATGDLMARVIGQKYGRKIIFNKSLEGSGACLVSCLLIGMLISKISQNITLLTVAVGAVTATLVELLPIPINDNLTIPVLSAGMMTLTASYI